MLAYGRDWLGRPVLTGPNRRRLGEVADLLLDAAGRRVVGLVVRLGNWLGGQRIVPLAHVREAAPDGIVVEAVSADGLATLSDEQTWGQLRDLAGKRLLSRAGEELGLLDDIAFDARTGLIENYRLTTGFVSDLLHGRPRLHGSLEAVAGDHVVLGIDATYGGDLS